MNKKQSFNKELYKKFIKLAIDTSCLGLAKRKGIEYFCTPIGAEIIGWGDEGIHYCFIAGLGDMVFAVNPCSSCDYCVYPLAENFYDFISLILAANGVDAIEQIILWNKQEYLAYLNSQEKTAEIITALSELAEKLGVDSMKQPFEYVKKLQAEFDFKRIPLSDEYYDVTGKVRQ